MVVRPALEGSTRLPKCAKKIALMSSDLPRENSATKGDIQLVIAQQRQHMFQALVDLVVAPDLAYRPQTRKSVIEPASVSRQAL